MLIMAARTQDCGNFMCGGYLHNGYFDCTMAGKTNVTYADWMRNRAPRDIPAFGCPCQQTPAAYVDQSIDKYLLLRDRQRKGCNNELQPCDALYISGSMPYSPARDANNHSYLKTLYDHAAAPNGTHVGPTTVLHENVVLVNPTAYHSVPVAINDLHSALYRMAGALPGQGSISVTNHPMPVTDYEKGSDDDSQIALTLVVAIFIGVGMSILSASYSIFLIWERSNNAKHLQMVSGVPKYVFVASNYLFDVLLYALPFSLLIAVFAAVPNPEFHGENLSAIAALLVLFATAAIPLAYLLHYPFRSNIGGFMIQLCTYSLLGLAMIISSVVLEVIGKSTQDAYDFVKYAYRLLPHYCLSRGIYDIGMTYFYNKYAVNGGTDAERGDMADDLDGMDDPRARAAAEARMQEQERTLGIGQRDVWDSEVTGYHFAFLAVESVVFLLLVLLVEYGENIFSCIGDAWHRGGFVAERTADDDDVVAESLRVSNAANSGEGADDAVLVSDLVKRYGSGVTAVNGISFGVRRGECFGLLGVNGAGKTSTFRMITSEYLPTQGDILVRKPSDSGAQAHLEEGGSSSPSGPSGPSSAYLSAVSQMNAVRKSLGYCPQFDGVHPNLTAVEHLRMYAAIRGYRFSDTQAIASELIDRLQLRKLADRRTLAGNYSGGNKRKLSVAIALVGEPPVVLLDEPSTGMDVDTKRFMWEVIRSLREQAVILTSHSMEECEALCDNVGIMVAGEFRCLGSLQHLKSKYGEGYSLNVILREGLAHDHTTAHAGNGAPPAPPPPAIGLGGSDKEAGEPIDADTPAMANLKSWLREHLPGVKQTDQHSTRHVNFMVSGDTELADVFELMEDNKELLGIDDYSLAQTSLEEIFIRFAQDDERA